MIRDFSFYSFDGFIVAPFIIPVAMFGNSSVSSTEYLVR